MKLARRAMDETRRGSWRVGMLVLDTRQCPLLDKKAGRARSRPQLGTTANVFPEFDCRSSQVTAQVQSKSLILNRDQMSN